MKPFIEIPAPDAVDSFSASLTTANRSHPVPFSIRDKIGCVSVLVTVVALMRLLLAN